MKKHILVSAAWPYANAEIHVGNLTGSYLPADIFARYQRLCGNDVLMVSGSDAHGTPITIRADQENTTPYAAYQRFHNSFLQVFQQIGLHYDLFSSTHSSNHFDISQKIFLALKENGYLYTDRQMQWYSTSQSRFLPDRYVEGECYICHDTNARSDQCDKCGNMLEADKLINPRSKVDGSTPELRETEHYYLDLGKLQPEVVDFLKKRQDYWRPNVMRQSLGQIEADALRGRAITRDLDWGIPVPLDGWDGKCLYVWFEAVIGYLSASVEWEKLGQTGKSWKDWWFDPSAETYYFIGKDNIPFHAVIWPAELTGVGTKFAELMGEKPLPLTLPYDVPANEFMNLEGQKISGSRNWAVWALDFLSRYDPDPLRYYLTANMPESKDTDWDWDDFYHRNNDELVATWGNLVNRVLSFTYKHWEGVLPDPGELRPGDLALLEEVEKGFTTISEQMDAVKLRAGLAEAIRLASEVNRYLDTSAPWFEIKTDKAQAAKSVYTAIKAIDSIKIMLAPFIPFTCEKLHVFLGYTSPIFGTTRVDTITDELGEHNILRYIPGDASGVWKASQLEPGRTLVQPLPLFKKLEPTIVQEERSRLGGK